MACVVLQVTQVLKVITLITSTTPAQRKHRKASNTHPDNSSPSQFYQHMKGIFSTEQDFAYGAGIMLVARMRQLSQEKLEIFVLKVLQILRDLAEDD